MEKEFNLSDKIWFDSNTEDGYNVGTTDIREFIRLLRFEDCIAYHNPYTNEEFDLETTLKNIKRKIDKLAGDKLK